MGLVLPGAELPPELAEGTHGTVETFVDCVFCLTDDVGGGRPGKGLLLYPDTEGVETGEAEPQDRVWETDERDDWAVLDLSFRTRFDLTPPPLLLPPPPDELTAQLRGIELPLLPLAAGSEG